MCRQQHFININCLPNLVLDFYSIVSCQSCYNLNMPAFFLYGERSGKSVTSECVIYDTLMDQEVIIILSNKLSLILGCQWSNVKIFIQLAIFLFKIINIW